MSDQDTRITQSDLAARLERQLEELFTLDRLWRQYEGDLARAIRAVTESAARALDIERTSVWRYDPERRAIRCRDLFEATPQRHSRGVELTADDFPSYFDAIESEEAIAAEDAMTDPRTREFAAAYLAPTGIGAMLDAPIRSGGALVGVLCHEHVGGPRQFHRDEIVTASHLANMVAGAVELQRRIDAELEMQRSLSLLRAVFEASGTALLALDAAGRVIEHNELAAELWHLTPELIGPDSDPQALQRHIAERTATPERFLRRTSEVVANPQAEGGDIFELRDGRVIECTSRPQRLDDHVIGRVWSYRDITDQHRLEAKLRELSYHDALTGLLNRRRLEEILEVEIMRTRRSGQPLCVGILDIDRFKEINDVHGHEIGDEVLRALAVDLGRRLRSTDETGRWGGEEFVVVLHATKLPEAVLLLDELRRRIAREREGLLTFTISAGVAEYHQGQSAADLIAAADAKMYEAKRAGRNRVVG